MAIRITPPRDDRIERALANPVRYFAEARRRARAEVTEDMEREQRHRSERRIDGTERL
ncbi:MAG: hypothetical protein J2P24_09340 [Streptosporangiales bacterium]|nr:hypothetical protein [Streptosporangiales bacterium]MBO0890913.1 hypothetical protein [Acidothermales bacterium]